MGSKVIRNVTKILKATSGRLFGRVTSGTGRAEELLPADVRTLLSVPTSAEVAAAYQPIGSYAAASHTHTASQVTDFSEATDDRVAALLTAGTNITITYNDASNTLTIASTAGGLSGTGSVDNAALRADGTGGATLQNSSWIINDNLTASPNSTVNHACLEAIGGTTNVSVSIKPKGTGAFCLAAPDGATTGGNVRGTNAVDLQTSRSAAAQVASGDYSFTAGRRAIASGQDSVAIGAGRNGSSSTASGMSSLALVGGTASADQSVAIGKESVASGAYSVVISGLGGQATAQQSICLGGRGSGDVQGKLVFSYTYFSVLGDAQWFNAVLSIKTTSATPATLLVNSELASSRLSIPSGKLVFCDVLISGVKSDGSAAACYKRKVAIKNVGGTTSLVGSVETIGTDIEDNAGTDVAITADNTNDALQINVTGIAAETWRWVAVIEGLEIAYGT